MSGYIPLHNAQKAHEIFVEEGPRREAMSRLHKRIEEGESPFEVLGIQECHKYYVDKLVAGLCPMSYAVYGRIMNLDVEDDFSV